jgi:hypothetical protein
MRRDERGTDYDAGNEAIDELRRLVDAVSPDD